jgi:phenylalanyl-tRNA synthetase beta chain
MLRAPQVGIFGVVHPEVLAAFDITNAVSALELNIEPFCFDQFGRSLLRRLD